MFLLIYLTCEKNKLLHELLLHGNAPMHFFKNIQNLYLGAKIDFFIIF